LPGCFQIDHVQGAVLFTLPYTSAFAFYLTAITRWAHFIFFGHDNGPVDGVGLADLVSFDMKSQYPVVISTGYVTAFFHPTEGQTYHDFLIIVLKQFLIFWDRSIG